MQKGGQTEVIRDGADDELRSLLNAVTDMMIIKDAEGKWIDANEATLNFFQLQASDFVGKTTADVLAKEVIHPDNMKICEQGDAMAWSKGQAVTYEQTFMQPSGKRKHFDIAKVPVYYPDGRPKWLIVTCRDNTLRNLMEEEITLAVKVFDNVNDGIFVTDVEGTILFVNPAFTKVTGYTMDEVVGKNPRLLKSGRQGAPFYKIMWDNLTESGEWQGEIWNRRKDGRIYPEELTINAIKDINGATTHYIATFRDISEREQLRKEMMLTGRIQRKLLPSDYADERVSIKAFFKPSLYVSGDFYDYIWLCKDELLFGYVIDVMGHGYLTALQAAIGRVLFMQAAEQQLSLKDRVAWVNREVMRYFSEDTFAAGICFEFDFTTNTLSYVTCGINCFLAATRAYNGVVKAAGLFLGITEEAVFEQHDIPFQSGDSFYFMSDGLFDELAEESKAHLPPFAEMSERIKKKIYTQKYKDDVSVLAFSVQ